MGVYKSNKINIVSGESYEEVLVNLAMDCAPFVFHLSEADVSTRLGERSVGVIAGKLNLTYFSIVTHV